MKYDNLVKALEDNKIYTPSTIANFADENNWVDARDPEVRRLELQRIRIAMGRYSNNHGFPDDGDGTVTVRGQPPTPGWYGWRWKAGRKKSKSSRGY